MFGTIFNEPASAGTAGVYGLVHKLSGATYVGASVNYPARRSKHFRDLCRGIHHNGPLQALVTRDGLAAVAFEVWWIAPIGASKAFLREAEDAAMVAVCQMGRQLLNVPRPATQFGRAFSIGPGGRWAWRMSEPISQLGDLGGAKDLHRQRR